MSQSSSTSFPAMHALGRAALRAFGLSNPTLRLLRHEHNTTFRVHAGDSRWVLRINRPGVQSAETINSEMLWLEALSKDADIGVPVPVRTTDGRAVATLDDPAMGVSRHAVLLQWQAGRFVADGLTPKHLAAVASLQAKLHRYAANWTPPPTFVRPRVDTLTNTGKRASISPIALLGAHPSVDDVAEALSLVHALMGEEAKSIVHDAISVATKATSHVEAIQDQLSLIHADLHYENFLFDRGVARAIDFDDCGWGTRLYDIAITLWELQERDDYPKLRDAFFNEYARHLSVPQNHEALIAGLLQLRRTQILLWILESRNHPTFASEWRAWAGEELEAIKSRL